MIQAGNYVAAHAILQRLDHPKAQAWLQKVEEKLAQAHDENFFENLNQSLTPPAPVYYAPPPPPIQTALPQARGEKNYTVRVILGILWVIFFVVPTTAAFIYGTISLFAAERGEVNPSFAVAWYLLTIILGKASNSFMTLFKA